MILARVLVRVVADALAPVACAACDARLRREAVFCCACAATVERACDARAYAVYGGAIALAIRRFKYAERSDLARPLGELLRRHVRRLGARGDLVVPVPLHPKRLAARGFNQAALLASSIAGEVGAKLAARALVRVRDTPQQAQLPRAKRLANVSGAFTARCPDQLRGRHVLLVDDVLTTGATLRACSEALIKAGAATVEAVVLATAADATNP